MSMVSGKSEWNSISFSRGNITSTATRNGQGQLMVDVENDSYGASGRSVISVFAVFGVLSLAKNFVLMPFIKSGKIDDFWYLSLAIIYSVITLIGIVICRLEGGEEFLKNHGAEHMVIKAYLKLGKIPTIEEASCFYRIHKSCGVSLLAAFITAQLIGYFVYIWTGYVISEIILVLIPLFFFNSFPFNLLGKLLQFFTTAEPDEENLELAIVAIAALDAYEIAPDFGGLFLERISPDGFNYKKTIFRM